MDRPTLEIDYDAFKLEPGMPRREYRVEGDRIFCDRRGCPGSMGLRDYRTNVPICSKCSVKTPVGYLSKDAARVQQDKFFNASSFDYVLAAVSAFVASLLAGFVVAGLLGGFFLIPLVISAPAGAFVSEVVFRVLRRRRGRYIAQAVGAGMLISVLALLPFTPLLSLLIYTVIAIGAAMARFQLGLRL